MDIQTLEKHNDNIQKQLNGLKAVLSGDTEKPAKPAPAKRINYDSLPIGYMDEVNLFYGFSEVLHMACKEEKRQINKKEQRTLFTSYTRACNKHQLVIISKHMKPLAVCGGSVWQATSGSVARFLDLVANKLGRELTLREENIVKPQFTALIKQKRTDGGLISNTRIGEPFKTFFGGEPNLWNRLMQSSSEKLKSEILASVQTSKTLAKNLDWRFTFDFNLERKAIRVRLAVGKLSRVEYCKLINKKALSNDDYKKHLKRAITHSEYNEKLKILKDKKQDVELFVKHTLKPMRNKHKNSGSIHVNNNIKGSTDLNPSGSRYTYDDYIEGSILPDYRKGTMRDGVSPAPATKQEKFYSMQNHHKCKHGFIDDETGGIDRAELVRYMIAMEKHDCMNEYQPA